MSTRSSTSTRRQNEYGKKGNRRYDMFRDSLCCFHFSPSQMINSKGFECVNHLPDCSTIPKGRQGECIRCYMRRYMKGYKLKQKAKQAQAASRIFPYYPIPAAGVQVVPMSSQQYMLPMVQQAGYTEMPQVYSAGLLSMSYGSYPLPAGESFVSQPLPSVAPQSNTGDTTHLPSIFNGEYPGPLPYSCPEIGGFWANDQTTPATPGVSPLSTAPLTQSGAQPPSRTLPTITTPLTSTAPTALMTAGTEASTTSTTVSTAGSKYEHISLCYLDLLAMVLNIFLLYLFLIICITRHKVKRKLFLRHF